MRKIISLTLSILLALTLTIAGPALAMAPVNIVTIRAAIDYGKERADDPLTEFLQPWTVYEEKADRLDGAEERAYLWTPFLLMAAETRERTQARRPALIADMERVLTDYNGYVIFAVTLVGANPEFADKLSVNLQQGRKRVKPDMLKIPVVEKQALMVQGQPQYQAQVYLYFHSRDVVPAKPATLKVTADDKRLRSFYFPLAAYR